MTIASQCIQLAKDQNVPINLNFNLNLPFSPSVNSASNVDSRLSVPNGHPSRSQTANISLDAILDIPKEGKYSQVRRYIYERCRFDPEFKHRVEDSSRVELCTFLTHCFGWVVDPNSLGKNMNRKH